MIKGTAIEEANKIGSLLNSWGKIITVTIIAVSSCAMAYYKIFDTEREVALIKGVEILQIKKDMKEEFQLRDERSEKKYARAMQEAVRLEKFLEYHEGRILELEKELSFMKGQNCKR